MELTGLSREDEGRTRYSEVRVTLDTAKALRELAKAEGVTITEMLSAALFVWAQSMRPSYGARIPNEEKLATLLVPEKKVRAEPHKKRARKR